MKLWEGMTEDPCFFFESLVLTRIWLDPLPLRNENVGKMGSMDVLGRERDKQGY